MTDLKNWTEVTKGLYRYVLAANAADEDNRENNC